jgi:hypothetical protein
MSSLGSVPFCSSLSAACNADADERAGTALFAVSVRSIGGVGRTTDALRYLYAASSLPHLLQFYFEHNAMASRSAIRNARLVSGA